MRVAILLLALSTSAVASAQDLTITSKVTADGGAPQTGTSYVASDHLRMSQPKGNDVIFDLKSGDMTVLDGKKKTYYVITQKDIDDMAAAARERMNSPEMKRAMEQMKNLPPEQQKRMQAMMGSAFAVDVQKSGTTRTIAGYKCENWVVTIGEMSRMEECVTTELKFPALAWERFKKLSDSMKTMVSAMGPMGSNIDKMREQMQKMKGFPLATTQTTSIMGKKSVTASEVTAISRGPIPASAWQIPAGYTKVDSPMAQAIKRQH